ncbi:MAG: hypothetical protein JWN04_3172 [Myxococcaceae bacterium]|nr:hypothetical protein [Myxococcaceae bacterium]
MVVPMTRFSKSWLMVSVVLVLGACSDDSGKGPPEDDAMDGGDNGMDAGKGGDGSVRHDAAAADGGLRPPTHDAAIGDGGAPVDASSMDAAVEDSGVPAREDAGQLDAGHDAATVDAGTDAGDAGDAGHDGGAGVCGGETPHGCYTPAVTNDPSVCPDRAPESTSMSTCTTLDPFAGCRYNHPPGAPPPTFVTCGCNFALPDLKWVCQ